MQGTEDLMNKTDSYKNKYGKGNLIPRLLKKKWIIKVTGRGGEG